MWLRPRLVELGFFNPTKWIEIQWNAGPTDRIRQYIATAARVAYSASADTPIAWLGCPKGIDLPDGQVRGQKKLLADAEAAEEQGRKKYFSRREAKRRRRAAEQGDFSAAAKEGSIRNTSDDTSDEGDAPPARKSVEPEAPPAPKKP